LGLCGSYIWSYILTGAALPSLNKIQSSHHVAGCSTKL
jgi:hypothetical protein